MKGRQRLAVSARPDADDSDSPALQLLKLVWAKGMKDSWGRINGSMSSALRLAIGAGLEFHPGDFAVIYKSFRAGYWVGSEDEWIYASAIENLNVSAYTAWESYKMRKPFIANAVEGRAYGSTSLHRDQVSRKRGRLAVGFSLILPTHTGTMTNPRRWFVTGFDDDAAIVRLALYEHDHQTGKPKRLRKLNHLELADLCPAPKKPKKASEVRDAPQ